MSRLPGRGLMQFDKPRVFLLGEIDCVFADPLHHGSGLFFVTSLGLKAERIEKASADHEDVFWDELHGREGSADLGNDCCDFLDGHRYDPSKERGTLFISASGNLP